MNTLAITSVALAALVASPAMAQGLPDDINARLEAQINAARGAPAVRDPSGAGATRGFELDFGGPSRQTGGAEVSAERREPSGPAAAAPVAPASAGPGATTDYRRVPPEMAIDFSITFETNSAFIRASSEPLLADLCRVLSGSPAFEGVRFRIIGHADASGGAAYNRRLSAARAQEVKRHLVQDCGMDEARLETLGVGEDYLLDGVAPVSEAQRRVELQVAPGGA